MKILILGFLQTFFIAQQSRNYAQSRYLAAFVLSIIIGIVWSYAVRGLVLATFPFHLVFLYSIGTGIGAIVGTLFHKKLMKRKKISDW